MNKLFVIAALMLLIIGFGCTGVRGKVSPAKPSSGLGDSDISPQSEPTENSFSNEVVIPLDNQTDTPLNAPSGISAPPHVSGQLPTDQDLVLSNDSESDFISQEDVVEPG